MKKSISLALCTALLPPSLSVDEPRVRWNGESYPVADLPAELGPGPRSAIESWGAWSLAHGYEMTLDHDARVLLIAREGSGKLARQLELIAETTGLFDELLPAPPRAELAPKPEDEGPANAGEKRADGEIPEDPEHGPVGWQPEGQPQLEYSWSYEWGAGTWPVDTETCVMFVVRDERDYGSLVEQLGEMQEYLRPWVPLGKKLTGFVHEKPLAAAYIENASGMEEWDPENELVHRVAQMLFVRRFSSQQPYWLVQGFAWYVENEIRGGIYCFPYRDEFVWATEHTAWEQDLRRAFAKREGKPLRVEEFASWKQGTYDGDAAKIAFGLVGFVAGYHRAAFSPFVEALRLHTLEHNRIDLGNGTWERRADYVVPAQDQRRLLLEHFGQGFLKDASDWFREGEKLGR